MTAGARVPLPIAFLPFVQGQDDDPLAREFRNPPDPARPRTWWHWTMSNVTKPGITKDLEWMKRVGMAGFQLADVNFGPGAGRGRCCALAIRSLAS